MPITLVLPLSYLMSHFKTGKLLGMLTTGVWKEDLSRIDYQNNYLHSINKTRENMRL